jgi:hypothetical protein
VAGTSVPATFVFITTRARLLVLSFRAVEIRSTSVAFVIDSFPSRKPIGLSKVAVYTHDAAFCCVAKLIERNCEAVFKIQRKKFLLRISLCKSARYRAYAGIAEVGIASAF